MLKFLHFCDNTQMPPHDAPDYNRLYKIQPATDNFVHSFKRYFHPGQTVSIDESMVGYKGKTPLLRQYMPNKHHARFGVKVWCVCDAQLGFTCTFEVFKGAADPRDVHEEGVTHNLVVRLLGQADILYQGHHVGMDNYFSSPTLFEELYNKGTMATGTVRTNRKGLALECAKAKLKNQEVSERRKGPLLCVAYKDKSKQPILLSTKAGFATLVNRQSEEKNKPKIVNIYIKVMGGVDLKDTRLYAYLSERRTMKWTTKICFSLVGTAILNCYIIYKINTAHRPVKTRYDYMLSVIEALVGRYTPKKIPRHRRTREQMEREPQLVLVIFYLPNVFLHLELTSMRKEITKR